MVPVVIKSQKSLMFLRGLLTLKAYLTGVLSPSRTALLLRIKLCSPREWLLGDEFLCLLLIPDPINEVRGLAQDKESAAVTLKPYKNLHKPNLI